MEVRGTGLCDGFYYCIFQYVSYYCDRHDVCRVGVGVIPWPLHLPCMSGFIRHLATNPSLPNPSATIAMLTDGSFGKVCSIVAFGPSCRFPSSTQLRTSCSPCDSVISRNWSRATMLPSKHSPSIRLTLPLIVPHSAPESTLGAC